MDEKYYVVFITWNCDESYGIIDTSTYLAQICKSEEDAKAYIDSPKCKKQMEEISEQKRHLTLRRNGEVLAHLQYYKGNVLAYYEEFSNNDEPLLGDSYC